MEFLYHAFIFDLLRWEFRPPRLHLFSVLGMKKFLRELVIIFAVILLLAIIINYRFGKNYYNHYELQYKELVTPKKKIDGIILGTSHGTHGIRPEVLDSLGIGFYNF